VNTVCKAHLVKVHRVNFVGLETTKAVRHSVPSWSGDHHSPDDSFGFAATEVAADQRGAADR
jgi:hypothetical protein